jgi:hypothetical protein
MTRCKKEKKMDEHWVCTECGYAVDRLKLHWRTPDPDNVEHFNPDTMKYCGPVKNVKQF